MRHYKQKFTLTAYVLKVLYCESLINKYKYIVFFVFLKLYLRTSLAVQWLGLHTFTAVGLGSIPGRGTKIPQASRHGQKKKKKNTKPKQKTPPKPCISK